MTPRRLATVAAGLLLTVIAALIIALSLVDPNDYRDRLLAYLTTVTGRSVAIDGELDIELSLRPALVAEGVRIGNADWGTQADMISIERLETRVGILPLLTGGVDVAAFTLIGTDVLLERNAEGSGNWELGTGDTPADGAATRVAIRMLTVERASLVFRKAPGAEPVAVSIDTLALTPHDDAPLGIRAAATIAEHELQLAGTIGALAALADNQPLPFDLLVDYDGYEASFEGALQRQPAGGLSLALSGNTDSITGLSAELELAVNGDRPRLSGDIRSETITLDDDDTDDGDNGDGAAAPARVFSDEPLPLEALAAIDLDLRLAVGRVSTARRELADINAVIALHDRMLVVKPLEAGYAGGRISAALELNGAAQTPTLAAELAGADMALGRIDVLADLISGAPATIDVKLRGSGVSPAAIAASSSGQLRVEVGPGTITSGKASLLGADLLMQSLNALNPAGDKEATELECAVLNFPLREGIASNDNGIALQTSRFVVLGGGRIDLKTEQLDLALKPKAREGLGIGAASLASLVRLRGTLTEPEVGADARGVAAAGARIGAAIFTGGLSVLAEGALKKASSGNLAVCDVARGTVTLEASSKKPAGSGALDSARDAGSKAVRSGKSLFKKLFD